MIQNILIIGAGDVGSHISAALVEQIGSVLDQNKTTRFKLFIYNRTYSTAQKTVNDLSSKMADKQSHVSVLVASEVNLDILINIVDVIFYTAGVGVAATQQQGAASNASVITRHSNIQDNLEIVENFCEKLKNSSNKPYIIISSNPAETLIRHFCQLTDIPSTKILGCGLRVDELRMNYFATEILNQHLSSPHQVTTRCLGYHSAQGMVFPERFIEIDKKPMKEFKEIDAARLHQILLDAAEKTKKEGVSHALIVGRSAYWAHAKAISEIFMALVTDDQESLHSMTVLFKDFDPNDYQELFVEMPEASAETHKIKRENCCLGVPVQLTQEGARIGKNSLTGLNSVSYIGAPCLNTSTQEHLIWLSRQEMQRSTAALNTRQDFNVVMKEARAKEVKYSSITESAEIEAAAELYNKGQLIQAKHAFQCMESNIVGNGLRLRINLSLGVILTMLHEYHGPDGAIALYKASLDLWLHVHKESKDGIEYQALSAALEVLDKPQNDVQSQAKKRKYELTKLPQELSDSSAILTWVSYLNDQDPGCYKINKALPAHHAYSKVRIFNNVGILCLALGELDKASILFQLVKASKSSSNFYTHAASQNAALVDARRGEYAQSLEELDATRPDMLDKSDPLLTASTYNAYGLVYYATGNYRVAKDNFLICLKVLSNETTIKNSLTNVYIAYAFLNIAKASARMITTHSPDNEVEQTMRYVRCSFNIFKENNISYPSEQIFETLEHRM